MIAYSISIGQELLLGDTINTNVAWIGRLLSEHGIPLKAAVTIGDDAELIKTAVRTGLEHADVVFITGGLGPTHDDITKKALSEYFNTGFVRHQPSYDHIRDIFARRNIPFTDSNKVQADVLENADVLFNKTGTAPGMWIESENGVLVVMPGVPREMKYLMQHEVMPRIKLKNGDTAAYFSKYFQITGIGESNLSDTYIGDISKVLSDNVTLAYLPHAHGITLRISSYAKTRDLAETQAEPLISHIIKTAGEFIYSDLKNETLEEAVVKLLARNKFHVATSESCSGGHLANLITNVSGSSAVFNGGFITYSNELKTQVLNVSDEVLAKDGAVSKPVALQMAKEAAKLTASEFGLSTTGIAGPTGGTSEKPVGLVWIGFWSESAHFAIKAQLFNDRELNKERSSIIALETLRRHLLQIDSLPYELKKEYHQD